MHRFTRFILACVAVLVLSGAPVLAAPLTITFETLPGADGVLGTPDDVPASDAFLVPMQDQYASIGLTFAQGSLLRDSFFDGNPDNHFLSSIAPSGTFSVPVFGISIQSNSYWDAFLTAYDAGGNIIASAELLNPQSGSEKLFGLLTLTTTQAIASFMIAPDHPDRILNLDNLVLTVGEVPEPAPAFLLALGMGALVVQRRLRRRK